MRLAKDGIFPIVKDKDGHLLPDLPASGFQFAGTVQGEGKLCGIPSLFVRLAGCNLQCHWQTSDGLSSPCDSAYAAYQLKDTRQVSVEAIYTTLLQNAGPIRHIVLTGGEPLLQVKELKALCQKLKSDYRFHLTLETNATLFDPELARYIDLFSLSPKLSSSYTGASPLSIQRLNPECIQQYISSARQYQKDFQLKFVYACDEDIDEIQQLLSVLQAWKNDDILLMPLGGAPEIMRRNMRKTLEHCIRNNWRYCDRLHISLFGDKAGV